ncbi:CRISPR-associated helicase/endonuclease Cas3 [Konateibacter massiliensis]|uniref:CRISPR-associated helicase/endonuclease Cas3 n=1 Tax=Konateibacter massiliensis TaxID=2002841 RepID=UPI000C14872B|nr:CRISPR-associated helicase/endonuclease Cas3 [Konateibacter massiliensis]
MDWDKYNAKSNKTIARHSRDLIERLEIIRALGLIPNEYIYNMTKEACLRHDCGKVNEPFQIRVNSEKEIKMMREKEIPHNVLSMLFINPKDYEKPMDYYRMLYVVGYHHNYCKDVFQVLSEEKTLVDELMEPFQNEIYEIRRFRDVRNKVFDVEKRAEPNTVWIKGLLHKCDYSASAETVVEYKNDFLKECLQKFKETKQQSNQENGLPTFEWKKLQKDCMDKTEENIIVVAQTGMGKTEAGLHWIGDNKGFFVLPVRTAINSMYDRINEEIICKKDTVHRLALLHSDTREYYLKNENNIWEKNENINEHEDSDLIEYAKRSRELSMPLTVCTMDQIFDCAFRYPGYEMKLVTLAYSKIVIDEIQMYEPRVLACLIYGLQLIHKMGGKFAIITATLPPYILNMLDFLQIEVKEYIDDEVKRHKVKLLEKEINAEDIYNQFLKNKSAGKSNKILVVCNTIMKAQELYNELKDRMGNDEKINVLHSRFIKGERIELEEAIRKFGKSVDEKGNVHVGEGIWISTSLVEASLDIDFDYLFTELQELSSLLQRLGRCNRQGLKPIEEVNCFIYCKKGRGIYDEDMFEISKKALLGIEDIMEGRYLSESEKMELINKTYTVETVDETGFIKKYNEVFDELKVIAAESKSDAKIRDIFSVDIMPSPIYEKNKEKIDETLTELKNTKSGSVEHVRLISEIRDMCVSIPYGYYAAYIKAIKAGKADKLIDIKLNKYEAIPVMECHYGDDKKGFYQKKFDTQNLSAYML